MVLAGGMGEMLVRAGCEKGAKINVGFQAVCSGVSVVPDGGERRPLVCRGGVRTFTSTRK